MGDGFLRFSQERKKDGNYKSKWKTGTRGVDGAFGAEIDARGKPSRVPVDGERAGDLRGYRSVGVGRGREEASNAGLFPTDD